MHVYLGCACTFTAVSWPWWSAVCGMRMTMVPTECATDCKCVCGGCISLEAEGDETFPIPVHVGTTWYHHLHM